MSLRTLTQHELKEVLRLHSLWLGNSEGGARANLRRADLRRADLSGADLRDADLRLADLSGADLRDADLRRADLSDANLSDAYLSGADLRRADLSDANLSDAGLRRADLSDADLSDADLSGANLPNFSIVPEVGSFHAFKKTTRGVIEVLIPSDAKRTSSLIGRKCRASHVQVIGGEGVGGKSPTHGDLVYNLNTVVHADNYDDDIRVECTGGIHFFMTKKEAEDYI